MRVVVVEPLSAGGLIHYAYQLCTALAEEGIETTLITAQEYELAELPHVFEVVELLRLWTRHDSDSLLGLENRFSNRLLQRLYRPVRRVWRGLRLVRGWFQLMNYLLDKRPDIVQFGKINFPFEAIFLRWLRFRGLILTDICHEYDLREQKDSFLGQFMNRFYRKVFDDFDLIFLHAEANRREFLEYTSFPAERTCVIPLGNQNLFLGLDHNEVTETAVRQRYALKPEVPVVLFFGNLTYSKGLPELVEAFTQIPPAIEAKLLVAGYPTKFMDLPAFKKQIEEMDLQKRIILDLRYIPVEEVAGLMKIALVVVYPYRSISQSGSLQVAYSFGKPVIATRVGGLPEVVEDGKSGLLVESGSIKALAAAIQKLIEDPDLAEQMGAYARNLSRTRFSWESIAGQVNSQYEQLLKSRTKAVS